jgi:hypothetical protein
MESVGEAKPWTIDRERRAYGLRVMRFAGTVSKPATVTIQGSPATVDASNRFSRHGQVDSGRNTRCFTLTARLTLRPAISDFLTGRIREDRSEGLRNYARANNRVPGSCYARGLCPPTDGDPRQPICVAVPDVATIPSRYVSVVPGVCFVRRRAGARPLRLIGAGPFT